MSICVVGIDSVCSDFKTARLLLSHYGFLNLEGLKVIFHHLFFVLLDLNSFALNSAVFLIENYTWVIVVWKFGMTLINE